MGLDLNLKIKSHVLLWLNLPDTPGGAILNMVVGEGILEETWSELIMWAVGNGVAGYCKQGRMERTGRESRGLIL